LLVYGVVKIPTILGTVCVGLVLGRLFPFTSVFIRYLHLRPVMLLPTSALTSP